MDAIQAIMTRVSTRQFTDQPIPEDVLHTILEAGMAGPSAVNVRPWSFVVVRDKDMLNRMADGNGRAAEPLRRATLGVLVCGDLQRAFDRAPDYWVIDGTIACQNMILAAHAMGVGSVWLGTWPQQEKMQAQKALFDLPEHIVPHSIIAFGYPAGDMKVQPDRFEADRVHCEKW